MYIEILKTIHIASACAMVGTTFGNGVLHGIARGADRAGVAAHLLQGVMAINYRIMGPAFVGLVATGVPLAMATGATLADRWLLGGVVLTAFLILAFYGGLKLERAMHRCAAEAAENEALPADYQSLFKRAVPIGGGATLLSLLAIFIMVAKP